MRKKTYKKFIRHFTENVLMGLVLTIIALYVGMLGYHFFEKMSWIDAFANAAMILSGMGPMTILSTSAGKIFAGCYALFSGLVFIALIALIFTPIIHHIFRKTHLEFLNDN